jgi:hypothetical protein
MINVTVLLIYCKNDLKASFEMKIEIEIMRQMSETKKSVYNSMNEHFRKYCITAATIDLYIAIDHPYFTLIETMATIE